MAEKNRDDWVRESAAYIRQMQERAAVFAGHDDKRTISARDELAGRLEQALGFARKLSRALEPIDRQIQLEGLPHDFSYAEDLLQRARADAIDLKVRIELAAKQGMPSGTKRKDFHISAVRLAHAFEPGSGARQLAKDIIREAGLDPDYSDASLSNWLNEVRQEQSASDTK